jgi:hypothetical protein
LPEPGDAALERIIVAGFLDLFLVLHAALF